MLRKAFAGLLLVLTLLPFTAPFPTCDATTLFGGEAATMPHQATVAATADDGSHAVPMFASSGRLRLRLKFISKIETEASAHRLAVPALLVARAAASAPPLSCQRSLTALRI